MRQVSQNLLPSLRTIDSLSEGIDNLSLGMNPGSINEARDTNPITDASNRAAITVTATPSPICVEIFTKYTAEEISNAKMVNTKNVISVPIITEPPQPNELRPITLHVRWETVGKSYSKISMIGSRVISCDTMYEAIYQRHEVRSCHDRCHLADCRSATDSFQTPKAVMISLHFFSDTESSDVDSEWIESNEMEWNWRFPMDSGRIIDRQRMMEEED